MFLSCLNLTPQSFSIFLGEEVVLLTQGELAPWGLIAFKPLKFLQHPCLHTRPAWLAPLSARRILCCGLIFFHTSVVQQSCLSHVASVCSFFRAASGLTAVTWFEHYSCQRSCCIAHFTFSKSFHGAIWVDLPFFLRVLSGDGSWLACEMKAPVAVFSLLLVLSDLKACLHLCLGDSLWGYMLEYSRVRRKENLEAVWALLTSKQVTQAQWQHDCGQETADAGLLVQVTGIWMVESQ